MLLALLSLGLCVPSASPGPAATRTVKFKPYTFGFVRDGFLGAVRPRNRILIGRTRAQGFRWDEWIWHNSTAAPQAANFVTQVALGVFLLDRPAHAVQGVVVTSLAVSDGTLSLTLKVSPYPITLHGPGADSPDSTLNSPRPLPSGITP